MPTIDEILNFGIPFLLLLIAFGFIYTKFLSPWVVPWLVKFVEWLKGTNIESSNKKEITYE
jgi:hypothetical protein